jgi:hypothetical protein
MIYHDVEPEQVAVERGKRAWIAGAEIRITATISSA